MSFNVFKLRYGKPMIDSKNSARDFLYQIKNPFTLRIEKDTYIRVRSGNNSYVMEQYQLSVLAGWCDVEWIDWATDQELLIVDMLYKYRKLINARFRQ